MEENHIFSFKIFIFPSLGLCHMGSCTICAPCCTHDVR